MQVFKICSVLSLALILMSCKTRRRTADITEVAYEAPKSSGSALASGSTPEFMDALPTNYLRVTDLVLPSNPAAYERVGLTLTSAGLATQDIYDYTLGDTLDLEVGKKYNVVVQLISGENLIYTNETCSKDQSFVAKSGSNDISIPVCTPKAKSATDPTAPVGNSEEPAPIPVATP